jgi:hypothetical protein
MRKWECGIIRQRELRVEVGMWNAEKKDWEVWKVELGMRPPAHRGLRLRPGFRLVERAYSSESGKWEWGMRKKKMGGEGDWGKGRLAGVEGILKKMDTRLPCIVR